MMGEASIYRSKLLRKEGLPVRMQAHHGGRSLDRPPRLRPSKLAGCLLLCFCAWLLAGPPVKATEVVFDTGVATLQWLEGEVLDLRIELADAGGVTDALTWVVTASADRFQDGLFAWQLHWGTQLESLLVIPNDFLTARNFSFAQLGIAVIEYEPGALLHIQFPRFGPIPELVSPGDRLALHALWIGQEPLISMVVPEPDALAGAGAEAVVNSADVLSADPLPTMREFARGALIESRFLLDEGFTGASLTLARKTEMASYEIVRVHWLRPDPNTGIVSYSMDTLGLAVGCYELVITLTPVGPTYRCSIEITPAAE